MLNSSLSDMGRANGQSGGRNFRGGGDLLRQGIVEEDQV